MRLGGPTFGDVSDPDRWIADLKSRHYRAAYCPVSSATDEDTARKFEEAAKHAGILIAEVGAWSNPLSNDNKVRHAAIKKCQEQLALADRIGALCCVNIAGSRGEQWDGPHSDNFSDETFDLIVETTRGILDAVKPTRTFFTLETMPWVFPDSPDSYLKLLHAIHRPQFAVHLDVANMISSPRRLLNNSAFQKECFSKLGPYIKSCHAKDIVLRGTMTVHLDEVRPGLGTLDYGTFLREISRLPQEVPVMLEHLPNEQEYTLAAAYVRETAESEGIPY